MCLVFSIYHWGRRASPWNVGQIVSSLSEQRGYVAGLKSIFTHGLWNQIDLKFSLHDISNGKEWFIKLHNHLEFMNFKLKFESYVVNNYVWITMKFSVWGAQKDFRGPRAKDHSKILFFFMCMCFFPMTRVFSFHYILKEIHEHKKVRITTSIEGKGILNIHHTF